MKRILLLAVLLAVLPAAAHPQYLTSEPLHGDRLDQSPPFVRVTLTEAIAEDPKFEVLGPDGQKVDNADLAVSGDARPTLMVSMPPGLPEGVYSVNWNVYSTVDGHYVDDSFQFAVGDFEIAGRSSAPDRPDGGLVLAKVLGYTGFALALGALALLFWMKGDAKLAGKSLLAGTVLHLAGAALSVWDGRQGAGLPLDRFLDTNAGQLLGLRGLLGFGALIAAALWQVRKHEGKWLPIVAGAFVVQAAWFTARLGHSAGDGTAAVLGDAVHLVSAATWLGGLLLLSFTLRRASTWEEARVRGLRFANLAFACVAVLFLSGAFVSYRLVGALLLDPVTVVAALWGKMLYGKTTLFVVMLGLASFNRFLFLGAPEEPGIRGRMASFVRRLASSGDGVERARRFGRLALVEGMVGMVVLLLAGVLSSVSPPGEGLEAETFKASDDRLEAHVLMEPAPRAPGASSIKVLLWELVPQPDGTLLHVPIPADTCGEACRVLIAVQRSNSTSVASEAIAQGAYWSMERSVLWSEAGDHDVRIRVETTYIARGEILVPVTVGAA